MRDREICLAVDGFKAKLRLGVPVTVVNADHPSASLVEYLGRLPIDAVFIDCEQGSADVETVDQMARAARLMNIVSVVRLYSSEDWAIERYLGRSVDGLVIPRLETAAQAERVVAAVRYCCPENSDKKLIIIQIETLGALQKLDEFLRIDGIDAYFLGPVDLAKSLGFAGDYRRPEVQDAIDHAIAIIRSAGKVAGILVDRGNARSYANRGVQFLYTHANDFLRHGSDEFARLVVPSAR
jgi:4-hydroxy-2-oxoheptanedioate aldolase